MDGFYRRFVERGYNEYLVSGYRKSHSYKCDNIETEEKDEGEGVVEGEAGKIPKEQE